MSLRQILLSFHHQLRRIGQLYHIRPIPAVLQSHSLPVSHHVLRVPRPFPPPSLDSSLFTNIQNFARSILSFSRYDVQDQARRTAGYLRKVTSRPGRTVAPLLGFIAAFLQESKTDEFKTKAACVAVREEANEFSKANITKPQLDLSDFRNISDLEFGKPLGKGCNAAVYEARMKKVRETASVKPYDIAVKVLFNYSNYSNAEEVSRLFENELLPSRLRHSSIIDVFKGLVDDMPRLADSEKLFPSAMPQRLHPEGLGRNRTMFVLMNKHSCTLRKDLSERKYPLPEGLAVFAQLLEGIVKLGKENVVHRDIKSDNILLTKEAGSVVRIVISDFGCSLDGLRLNYTSPHISKGGNRALMAPEIVNASAGKFSVIDYSRSDLWAVGTVAYEIFAGFNPFFEGLFKMDSATYLDSQLPEVIEKNAPLNNLVHGILRRDPSKRPSPSLAATACHMILWDFPLRDTVPSLEVVRLWLMSLCVKLICGSRDNAMHRALLATFLKRCQLKEILEGWQLLTESRLV